MYECVYINLPSCRHIVDVTQNNSFLFLRLSLKNPAFTTTIFVVGSLGLLYCFPLTLRCCCCCYYYRGAYEDCPTVQRF